MRPSVWKIHGKFVPDILHKGSLGLVSRPENILALIGGVNINNYYNYYNYYKFNIKFYYFLFYVINSIYFIFIIFNFIYFLFFLHFYIGVINKNNSVVLISDHR